MDDAQLAKRLGAIERQLTLVSAQLGIDCPPFVGDALPSDAEDAQPAIENANATALPAEIVDLARTGRTTEAISRIRQLTGASLLEAKRAVDALAG
jgi:ribosomal protein L7/L12